MKKHDLSPRALRHFLRSLNDTDLMRYSYCYQLGSTFVLLNQMERTIIHAMGMCDRVKVNDALGNDSEKWRRLLRKIDTLQDSTLGSLINILAKHSIIESDLKYLRWLKQKRDHFIHRWFRQDIWPGEMSKADCRVAVRQLQYLEIIFQRGSAKIWRILGRAGLLAVQDLGPNGSLMMNPDALNEIFGDDWIDFATGLVEMHIENRRMRKG